MALQTIITEIHDDIAWAINSTRWDNIQTGAFDYELFYKTLPPYDSPPSSVSTIVIPITPGSLNTGYELKISIGNSFKGAITSSQDCNLDLKSIRSESLIDSGMPVGALSLSIYDSQGILSGYGLNGLEQIDINWQIILNNNTIQFTETFGGGKLSCRCWESGLTTIPIWQPIDLAGPIKNYFTSQTFPVIRILKR